MLEEAEPQRKWTPAEPPQYGSPADGQHMRAPARVRACALAAPATVQLWRDAAAWRDAMLLCCTCLLLRGERLLSRGERLLLRCEPLLLRIELLLLLCSEPLLRIELLLLLRIELLLERVDLMPKLEAFYQAGKSLPDMATSARRAGTATHSPS